MYEQLRCLSSALKGWGLEPPPVFPDCQKTEPNHQNVCMINVFACFYHRLIKNVRCSMTNKDENGKCKISN